MNLTLKRTLVVTSAAVLIGGAVWFAVDRKKKTETQENQTSVIETALNPRIGEALPPDIQAPPVDSPSTDSPSDASASEPEPAPGAETASQPPPPPSSTPASKPRFTIYQNPQLGFNLTMPAQWVAAEKDAAPTQEIFFVDETGSVNFGGVESYPNLGGETLDSMQRILAGSPDVSATERVIYRGHEGVGYHTANSTNEHFIFLVSGKIYYIHGEEVLTRLEFI